MKEPTKEEIQRAMEENFTKRCNERIERDRIYSELRCAIGNRDINGLGPSPVQLAEAIIKLHERVLTIEGEVEF